VRRVGFQVVSDVGAIAVRWMSETVGCATRTRAGAEQPGQRRLPKGGSLAGVPRSWSVAFLFGLVFPLVVIALIVLGVSALANGHREPDPSGHRAYSLYLALMTFVALFTTLFAVYRVASSGTRVAVGASHQGECTRGPGYISCRSESGGFAQESGAAVARSVPAAPATTQAAPPPASTPATAPRPPPDVAPLPPPEPPPGFVVRERSDANKERVREAVQTGFVALAAAAVLVFHGRRLRDLVSDPGFETSSGKRAYVVYLYAVCFVAVLAAVGSGAAAAYGLVRVIAPTAFVAGHPSLERDEGIVALVANGFLAVGAGLIFALHWRRLRRFDLLRSAQPSSAQGPGTDV
jgi:hypothetical protein